MIYLRCVVCKWMTMPSLCRGSTMAVPLAIQIWNGIISLLPNYTVWGWKFSGSIHVNNVTVASSIDLFIKNERKVSAFCCIHNDYENKILAHCSLSPSGGELEFSIIYSTFSHSHSHSPNMKHREFIASHFNKKFTLRLVLQLCYLPSSPLGKM